ncbi:MAG: HAD family hydrolase [Clostridia bacterium]|nr:HAD family hydrolase [Clostridia bacterium]
MPKTILFDLDGTLLPMDNDVFTKTYFGLLAKTLAPRGYDPEKLVKSVWYGTAAMVKNDGSETNDKAFWRAFAEAEGEHVYDDIPAFDSFYRNEFGGAKAVCGKDEALVTLVHDLKAAGYRVALATNPLFPAVATERRIRWAGFEPSDFELYTTYENIGYCKPNPAYYTEVAARLGASPADCIMVGNDAHEDTAAKDAGMKVFLLTDHLLNKKNVDITEIPHGDVRALRDYLFADGK